MGISTAEVNTLHKLYLSPDTIRIKEERKVIGWVM
jgi:hypothetical protein